MTIGRQKPMVGKKCLGRGGVNKTPFLLKKGGQGRVGETRKGGRFSSPIKKGKIWF